MYMKWCSSACSQWERRLTSQNANKSIDRVKFTLFNEMPCKDISHGLNCPIFISFNMFIFSFFLFSGDSSRRECVTSSRLSRSFLPRLPVLHQRQTKGCNPMHLNTSQTYGEPQAVVFLFYTPTFFFFFCHPWCMPGVLLWGFLAIKQNK